MISCTNLVDSLDKAVLRRFSWKVRFIPLDSEQRERLFVKWFSLAVLEPEQKASHSLISVLSPGDYKAVAQRLHPGNRDNTKYNIEQLEIEASYREAESYPGGKTKIGFSA